MYSRLHEIARLSLRYALVGAVFAAWGAVAGVLVFVAHWDETTLMILAVILAGATAFPLWEHFAPRTHEEQNIWVESPNMARLVPVATVSIFIVASSVQTLVPQAEALMPRNVTTNAQNVLA